MQYIVSTKNMHVTNCALAAIYLVIIYMTPIVKTSDNTLLFMSLALAKYIASPNIIHSIAVAIYIPVKPPAL